MAVCADVDAAVRESAAPVYCNHSTDSACRASFPYGGLSDPENRAPNSVFAWMLAFIVVPALRLVSDLFVGRGDKACAPIKS